MKFIWDHFNLEFHISLWLWLLSFWLESLSIDIIFISFRSGYIVVKWKETIILVVFSFSVQFPLRTWYFSTIYICTLAHRVYVCAWQSHRLEIYEHTQHFDCWLALCVCVFVRVYFLFGLSRQTNKSGDLINSNVQETREPFLK